VLACAMAADRLLDSPEEVRNHLIGAARSVAGAMNDAGGGVTA